MPHSQDRFPWLAALGVALAIGVLSALGVASMQRTEGQAIPWAATFISTVPAWLFWGVAAWPVYRTTERFPLTRPFRARSLLAHIAVAVVLVTAQTLLTVWLARMAYPKVATEHGWGYWFTAYLGSRGTWSLLLYGTLVAAAQAMIARRELRARELDAAHLETELARAQLHALQLQLQPHFLFNTLHAIGVLNQEDPARATRMIASLGDLLRGSLDNRAAKEITLEEELALLGHYLDIESVRFSDRLAVSIDVPPALRSCLVPTFSLQPLVENAVRHGVTRRPGAGQLRVAATGDNGSLRLSVWNDGPAIAPDAVDGIGISTTRDRLRRLYGDAGRLSLENSDGGVLATLELPMHVTPVL